MTAIRALVGEIRGDLRFLGKKPTCHAFGWYLCVDAFCATILAAQYPLRVVGHELIVRPRQAGKTYREVCISPYKRAEGGYWLLAMEEADASHT